MSELSNTVRFALANAQRSQFSWGAARPAWPEALSPVLAKQGLLPRCPRHLSSFLQTGRELRAVSPTLHVLAEKFAPHYMKSFAFQSLPHFFYLWWGQASSLSREVHPGFPPSTAKPPGFLHLLPLPLPNTPQ